MAVKNRIVGRFNMSFLIRDWLKTVVPIVEITEGEINSHDQLEDFLKTNSRFPRNKIIGSGTLVKFGDLTHIVTCNHVISSGERTVGMFYRSMNNTIVFRFLTAILDRFETEWVIDRVNDLALTVMIPLTAVCLNAFEIRFPNTC